MADHTGKNKIRKEQNGLDTNSIKMTTLISFVVFALFLVAVLWGLSNFFMNSYYERLRSQEVIRTADALETQFRQGLNSFDTFAVQAAGSNGIYIRMDTAEGSLIYDGTRTVKDTGDFEADVNDAVTKLIASGQNSITSTKRDPSGALSRLVYAANINAYGHNNVLSIVAPLYPDEATVRILRKMLIYISFIVLVVSFLLAFALSVRLSSPIENLTRSAKELSKGNYDVKFNGAGFTETKELAKALNMASYEMEKTDFYQREIIANVLKRGMPTST